MPYKVKQKRRELKMSQAELADKSGVSRATISALENGDLRRTTTDTLIKLAEALGCTVGDIFLP